MNKPQEINDKCSECRFWRAIPLYAAPPDLAAKVAELEAENAFDQRNAAQSQAESLTLLKKVDELVAKVAELELLLAAQKAEWHKAYDIGVLAKHKCEGLAAQNQVMREALKTCIHEEGLCRDHHATHTYSFDEHEVSKALTDAFELWVEKMIPVMKRLNIRERNIAKSAFRCAWEARGVYDSKLANVELRGRPLADGPA